jgi:hypothetical protein
LSRRVQRCTQVEMSKGECATRATGLRRLSAALRLLSGLLLVLQFVPLCALGVTISAVDLTLEAASGSQADVGFTILNDELAPLLYTLDVVDWDDDPDGVTRILDAGELDASCSGWIRPSPLSGGLDPSEEVEVTVPIDVPDVLPGTRWAGILVTVRSAAEASAGGLSDLEVVCRFLVRVYVTVPPTTDSGRVEGLEVVGVDPLQVLVVFRNDGDSRLLGVSGSVTVEGPAGETLLELAIPASAVLPEHVAYLRVAAPWGSLPPGEYWIRAVLDFGAPYLVAGQTLLHLDSLSPPPVGDAASPPQDLDYDGLYEDVNGDGVLNAEDSALLERAMTSEAVQQHATAFDFDGDGQLTEADVARLNEWVWRAP